jgi:hypothetical protein
MNGDSISELIEINVYNNISTSFLITDQKYSTIEQANIPGVVVNEPYPFYSDANRNGNYEFYLFTTIDSQLFINSCELNKHEIVSYQRKVVSIKLWEGVPEIEINPYGFIDINRDGFDEVIFTVMAGYSLQPRKLFAYDIINDTIFESPNSFAYYTIISHNDFNDDGFPIFLTRTWAPGNIPIDSVVEYTDQSAWIMIFDHQLNFKYKPIELPGFTSNVSTYAIKNSDKIYYLIYWCRKLNQHELIEARLYNNEMNLINTTSIEANYNIALNRIIETLVNGKQKFWHIKGGLNVVELINPIDFSIIKSVSFEDNIKSILQYDIDNDGIIEHILQSANTDDLIIYRHDFSNPVKIYFNDDQYITRNLTNCFRNDGSSLLSIQRGKYCYLIEYKKDYKYYLKFPYYTGIYLLISLIVYIIKGIQSKRIEEKYSMQRQLSELQIRSLKNQADPHFIFNTLNSISSVIYKEDKDAAYDYLNDFSRLIRNVILHADQIQSTLGNELNFTRDYLKLEKLRFKDMFQYEINIEKNINLEQKVPRMILQIYIENAIKHGIMHLKTTGQLNIEVMKMKNYVKLIVDDNGIGRENSKKFNSLSTGRGLKIMNEVFQLYEKLYNVRIEAIIKDKKSESGQALGTKVEILIPRT